MFGQKTAFGSPSFGSGSFLFGFGTPTTQSTGLFGSNPTTTSGGLFGSSPATPSGGLFGSSNGTCCFSARQNFWSDNFVVVWHNSIQCRLKGRFLGTSTGGMFGQSTTTTGSSLFGSAQPPAGTTVKFEPVVGSDTMLRNSIQTNITTKHQCITSMKHYEGKSLEELRVEDYLANRKGPQQAGSLGFGVSSQPQNRSLFGSTSTAATGTSVFGQTQDKPLFGSSSFGSTQPSTGLFGQPTTTQSTSLFGQNTTTSTSAFSFTNPTTTGGGLFGQSQPQQTVPGYILSFFYSPFGVAASTAPTSSGSLFGGSTGGGLFGNKPAGTTTSSLFPSFGPSTTTTFGGGLWNVNVSFFKKNEKSLFPFRAAAVAVQFFSKPTEAVVRHLRSGPISRMTSTPKPSLLPTNEAPPPPLTTSVILEESTTAMERESEKFQSRHGIPLSNRRKDHLGIVCKRAGYYCDPSLEELEEMIGDDGYCVVSNFTVGRENYGSVMWFGPLNVTGLNLDRLVHFDHKEVTVYPDGEVKPPVGEELNRRARIVLERVWPIDKSTLEPITFRNRLEKACARMEAKFVDYDSSRGIWTFEVDHFSKYGLVDEESSEEEEEVVYGAAAEVGDETYQQDDSIGLLRRSGVHDDQLVGDEYACKRLLYFS
ncbi:Nucleoporin2 and Nucleoporin FG domain containing protein [Trichuris trichiura]|uniref:Nuclear pore complex protein Nup98-Nup96 n=1 Tax=Trichuris trichiura TaxID=36087 RepID=A0A077ZBJ5_TRITR|nr:Nucleoporin2 and Nucleoporin FG domain containing protein [Trichuris trichiura]